MMLRRRLDSELNSQRTPANNLKLGRGPIFSLKLDKLDEDLEELYDESLLTPLILDDAKITDTVAFKEVLLHLDLKGAPPKFEFLLDLINFVVKKTSGGHVITGFLIEFEDMLPYNSSLQPL